MKKFLAIILALTMVVALGTVAFADDAKPGEGITIGVVYKQSGNAYFQAGVEGFQKAADELGFEFMHDGPEDSSNDGQERIIRNYIDQGVDVLAISANDAAGLVDVCKEAMEKGIVVLSWDAKVDPEGRDLDIEPASAKVIGITQLESLAESVGFEGKIGIVSAGATAPNQNLWIGFIQEEFAANPKYANMTLLDPVYGDDDYTKSYDVTKALLDANPDLKGLIVPTTVDGPAVSKCIMDEGLTGKVKVNGEFEAAEGATIEVPGFEGLEVTKSDDGGLILFLNKLNEFNEETVDGWIGIL